MTMDRRPIWPSGPADQGFTLIELLVVIVIIGVLAAIAIPTFLNQRNKGYDAQAKSDVRNLQLEIETFFTDQLVYPVAVVPGAVPTPAAANTVYVKASATTSFAGYTVVNDPDETLNDYCAAVTSRSGTTFSVRHGSPGVGSGGC